MVWLGALVLVVGLHACAATAMTNASPAGLDLLVATDKSAYARGEPILVTLQVVNRGSGPVELRFLTAQRYDVLIRDAQGRQVWRWSDGQMFAQVLGQESIEPGRKIAYRVTVRERLAPGSYTVTGVIPAEQGALSSAANIRID